MADLLNDTCTPCTCVHIAMEHSACHLCCVLKHHALLYLRYDACRGLLACHLLQQLPSKVKQPA
jgi:hypothetical protein